MRYKAFDFIIESELRIPILPEIAANGAEDISIRFSDLHGFPMGDAQWIIEGALAKVNGSFFYTIDGVGRFMISNGKEIIIDQEPGVKEELLSVFLLGRCMGAVFQQRGLLALHGACVCREGKALVICGESGSGKSTLATEFLANGWQLMTDDVALIEKHDDGYCVKSSYPSRKLWNDSIEYYGIEKARLSSLMQESRKEKFNVQAREEFYDGKARLCAISEMSLGEEPGLRTVTGADKLRRIVDNIYMKRILADRDENGIMLRRAMELATDVRFCEVTRNNDRACTHALYRKLEELF